MIQLLKWNFKVTCLDKPWALVRKYLRLAPEELSASVKMAAQFLEGCHPTHVLLQSEMCLAPPELSASIWFSSVCQWYGMTRNVDHWEKYSPPSNFIFKRVGIIYSLQYKLFSMDPRICTLARLTESQNKSVQVQAWLNLAFRTEVFSMWLFLRLYFCET